MKMPWSKEPRVLLEVKEVGAARAMYTDAEHQSVRLVFKTTDNQEVEFDLTVRQTAALIEQSTQAYYAIVPQLRVSRGLPFG